MIYDVFLFKIHAKASHTTQNFESPWRSFRGNAAQELSVLSGRSYAERLIPVKTVVFEDENLMQKRHNVFHGPP